MSALKKKDYAYQLMTYWAPFLKCPHCDEGLFLDELSLVCPSGHRFDGSKQGVFVLLKQANLKVDKVYDDQLFKARRSIMEQGMYASVYPVLSNFLKHEDRVVDMGSGEGCHDAMLKKHNPEIQILGLDLAKDGVRSASDFLSQGVLSIVADLVHVPLKDKSVDVVLNLLSPSNELEMSRILKDEGTVLKLVPKKDYLRELRVALKMAEYEPNEPDFIMFECVERIAIQDDFPLTASLFEDLVHMTPLAKHQETLASFESIHLDLELWVLKKKAGAF